MISDCTKMRLSPTNSLSTVRVWQIDNIMKHSPSNPSNAFVELSINYKYVMINDE